MSRITPLHIATAAAGEQPASPEHKRFKLLLGKIEAARARLAGWQAALPQFAQAHRARVGPVQQRLEAERRNWTLELGRIALGPWSKADRAALERMVVDSCTELLDSRDPDAPPDEELQALHDRFADADYASLGSQELGAMQAMMEASGLDLGDAPAESMEELMRRARESAARERTKAQGDDGAHGAHGDDRNGRPGAHSRARPKSAAQRRAEEEAKSATQTVREVYRKLAAALHPDRTAADAGAEARAERTALMQRANSAYETGDLLALLSLQLQIEQVDVAHAAKVAASQVRHFNRVLAEQLREIEAQCEELEWQFLASYGYEPMGRRLDPQRLNGFITDELRQLSWAEHMLQREQRALRGDVAGARRYLKQQRAEQRLDDEMDAAFDESMADLMTQVMIVPPVQQRSSGPDSRGKRAARGRAGKAKKR